jgi:hypothetical protein
VADRAARSQNSAAGTSRTVVHSTLDQELATTNFVEVADCPEAQALQIAICKAVTAYSDLLEDRGVIWQDGVDPEDFPRLKAQALVVTFDYGEYDGVDIRLKDGALDRVYRNGVNPDPDGRGPRDILTRGGPMIRRPSFNWAPLENIWGEMGELSNARHERFAQELEKTVPLRLVRCRLAPLRSELAVWGHATSGQRCRAPGTQADRCVTSVGNQRHRS